LIRRAKKRESQRNAFARAGARVQQWKKKQSRKCPEGKVLAILAVRLARTLYHLWHKGEALDEERFWQGQATGAHA
jgi:hypothetical protein